MRDSDQMMKTITNDVTKKITVLIFIFGFTVFFLNMLINTGVSSTLIFWITTIILILNIFYQIFYVKLSNEIVLLEIFFLSIGFKLIYQTGYYGLRGTDSYYEYVFLKNLLFTGHFDATSRIGSWPFLHLLSSEISTVSNIDTLILTKYMTSFVSSVIIFPLYLLINQIYDDKKIALLTCLVLITIPQFISFESCFVAESMGILFMMYGFYYVYNSKKRDHRFVYLLLISLPAILLSHHFSSFLFLILIMLYIISIILTRTMLKNKFYKTLKGNIKVTTIFLIILVVLLAYWIYNAVYVWDSFAKIFLEVIGINQFASYVQQAGLESPIISLRGTIIYYGFFIFSLLFAIILTLKVLFDKNLEKIEDLTFYLFFGFCGIYGFLSLYSLGSLIYPDRFLSFAWLFGLIPLTAIILSLKSRNYKKLNILFVLLLLSFVFYNLYNIQPSYIEKNYTASDTIADYKEYALAKHFILPSNLSIRTGSYYYGYIGVFGAFYDLQGLNMGVAASNIRKIKNFTGSSKFAIINENMLISQSKYLELKSKEDYELIKLILSYKDVDSINKLYDSGNGLYLLQGGGEFK